MADNAAFNPHLDAILAPFPGVSPAGRSMRYDSLYMAIRQSRQQDDATLPMGDWERPLKKADWKAVAAQCLELLSRHSKDLQVAAWLCEAWIHLHQIDGLIAGTEVLAGLVGRFWDSLHPQIEGDDDDARAAPFIWINDNLSRTLLLHLEILRVPDCVPSVVTLAQWGQTLVQDVQTDVDAAADSSLNERMLTRSDITASANGANLTRLIGLHRQLDTAIEKWGHLATLLDEKMKINSPSVAKVGDVLRRISRVTSDLIDGRGREASAGAGAAAVPAGVSAMVVEHGASMKTGASILDTFHANGGTFTSREEAYRHLELVAKYLQATEPHSPTPYLIKRAVAWGRMSLAELLKEAMQEDGDIGRFYSFLGIKDMRG